MGNTKAKWRGGQLAFYDNQTYETVLPVAPVVLHDDFLGTIVDTNLWTEVESADSSKAIALSVLTYHLAVTGESEDAGIYGRDSKVWNIDKGLIFEARVALHVLPTSAAEVIIGVQNDSYGAASQRVAGTDEIDKHALFAFIASGACVIYTDDGTVDHNAVATGITVVPDAYHIFRIDFTNSADVKFYIDGVNVAGGTTFKLNTVAALMVQPVVMVDKHTADAGLGDIYVDYIKLWQASR